MPTRHIFIIILMLFMLLPLSHSAFANDIRSTEIKLSEGDKIVISDDIVVNEEDVIEWSVTNTLETDTLFYNIKYTYRIEPGTRTVTFLELVKPGESDNCSRVCGEKGSCCMYLEGNSGYAKLNVREK
jgi:hypothetical protein